MLRVSMISAKAGMKLAMPVFHPESPSRVLLRSGFELGIPIQSPRKKLRKLGPCG